MQVADGCMPFLYIYYKDGSFFAFVFFSILLPLLSFMFDFNFPFYSCFWYLSISVVLFCIVWWLLVKRISVIFESGRPVIEFVSRYSFGIYLIHVLVLRSFLWKISWIQSLVGIKQIIVCTVLTFTISLFLSWLLSKLRFGKYIIGV